MRKCPKCSLVVADEAKICRVCGAILEQVDAPVAAEAQRDIELVEPTASSACAAEEIEVDGPGGSPWRCPTCGEDEDIDGNFDACWNCGTAADGTPDPDFVRERPDIDDPPDAPLEFPQDLERPGRPGQASQPCAQCGANRIIANAAIADQGEYSDGKLQAVVFGKPEALVFKDRCFGEIAADICGECGHIELRVKNPQELYEHYLRSLGSS